MAKNHFHAGSILSKVRAMVLMAFTGTSKASSVARAKRILECEAALQDPEKRHALALKFRKLSDKNLLLHGEGGIYEMLAKPFLALKSAPKKKDALAA